MKKELNTKPRKSCKTIVSGSSRHKWNGKAGNLFAVSCIKCGCIKEIVKGTVIYFINDTSYTISPNCH